MPLPADCDSGVEGQEWLSLAGHCMRPITSVRRAVAVVITARWMVLLVTTLQPPVRSLTCRSTASQEQMPSLRKLECSVPIYDSGQRRQDQRPAFASTSLDAFESTSARSSLRETPISESPISSASFSGVTLIKTASRARDLRVLVPVFKLSSWLDMVAFVLSGGIAVGEMSIVGGNAAT